MQVTELFTSQLEEAIKKIHMATWQTFCRIYTIPSLKYRKIYFTSVPAAGALCTRWNNIPSAMSRDICYYIPFPGVDLLKSPATAAI